MAGYGNDEALAAYLEVFPAHHITDNDLSQAMTKAMSHGRLKCVKILEAYTTPMPRDFCSAAAFGHLDVVKATVGYMSPAIIGQALLGAARFGHTAMTAYLLETGTIAASSIDDAYSAARRYAHSDTADVISRYRV